jgi:hypothetical protein
MKQPKTSDMEHVCIGNNAILVSFNYTYFIKYRFDRQSIMMICDMLQNDLESSTFRNRAYFSFMFYLHDISIQSLKLVSYITVERKILQIDEGGASKFKSGKLRNIMVTYHTPKLKKNTLKINFTQVLNKCTDLLYCYYLDRVRVAQ